MNRLAEIVAAKHRRVAAAKDSLSRETVEGLARQRLEHARPHAFHDALRYGDGIKIIAEFKRRSPSKGAIRSNAVPAAFASQYEAGGAAAISVLTEEDYFDGSLNDLLVVGQNSRLPTLRKDFIFDEYQIYESAVFADALLLIVASLDDETLRRLRSITEDELQMDALVEVHTLEEMKRAIDCGANIIGVNNRSLATFEVSLETSIELAPHAPEGTLLVSESGIETADHIRRLRAVGYRGFLVGETLMRAANPAAMIAELVQQAETANCPGK